LAKSTNYEAAHYAAFSPPPVTPSLFGPNILLSTLFSNILQLLITANIVPSSLILFTLMMEAIHSSETSILTGATQHHSQEDGILHCYSVDQILEYRLQTSVIVVN
jgi:hypothetical protein